MKAVVFGGTGFIGGHIVEQLCAAGHEVTAAVRGTSNTKFLETLGINIQIVDFAKPNEMGQVIKGNDVVYNCTADAKLHSAIKLDAPVEIQLTRTLIEQAAMNGASKFIQLSTIVLYDFRSNEAIDEMYESIPEYEVQQLAMERERVVKEEGDKNRIQTIIVRPASTIGARDISSFFSRLFQGHMNDLYPLIADGSSKVSLMDTRDIGRAMVFLGEHNEIHFSDTFLIKGFDTTWKELKMEMDKATGKVVKEIAIPGGLTEEHMLSYKLTPFAFKTLTVNRIWNDNKIRKLGFRPKYSLSEAVSESINDLLARVQ